MLNKSRPFFPLIAAAAFCALPQSAYSEISITFSGTTFAHGFEEAIFFTVNLANAEFSATFDAAPPVGRYVTWGSGNYNWGMDPNPAIRPLFDAASGTNLPTLVEEGRIFETSLSVNESGGLNVTLNTYIPITPTMLHFVAELGINSVLAQNPFTLPDWGSQATPNPTIYFAPYVGSYALAPSSEGIFTANGERIEIGWSTVTIAQIPEPSATGIIFGAVGIAVCGLRTGRSRSRR
jgi:hypothetical protein